MDAVGIVSCASVGNVCHSFSDSFLKVFWKDLSVMCKDLLKKKDWKMVEAYKSDERCVTM